MSRFLRRCLSSTLPLAAIVALSACGGGGSGSADLVTGEEIFSSNCAVCHRADGTGSIGPNISGGATVTKYPELDDQIRLVTDGRNAMPAFGRQLTAVQIETVVNYVRDDL